MLASDKHAAYFSGMLIGSLEFSPGRWPTVVTLILLGILVSLGFWQLDRAEQKRALLAQYSGEQKQTILQLEADLKSATGLNYQDAVVVGHYDSSHQFLLDNRIHAGQAGYQVLTPFVIRNSRAAVLVNRGWMPGSPMAMCASGAPWSASVRSGMSATPYNGLVWQRPC